MAAFIGLDLSLTSTGVAIITDAGIATRSFESEKLSPPKQKDTLRQRHERTVGLVGEVMQFITDTVGYDEPHEICVEQPSYASSGGSGWDRAGYWWLLTDALWDAYDITPVEVAPTSLKVYVTGDGKSSKAQMIATLARLHPDVDLKTDDEADAFGLALVAARLGGLEIDGELTQKRADTFAKIRARSDALRA